MATDNNRLTISATAEVNVLVMVKGGTERYVFMFDEAHSSDMLQTLGRFAENPGLSFSWYDCTILSKKIREARGTQ